MLGMKGVVVTQGTPEWYPGNLSPIGYARDEGVVVTQGTPEWYPGNLSPIGYARDEGVVVPPKGDSRNGTQAISVL